MFKCFALALICLCPLQADKRALTADDYDSWKHIQNQALSNDGHYLAYALFPQQGNGEVIIRDLKTGHEMHEAAGELPPPPPPDYSNPQREEAPPLPPGIALKFTSDSRFLVFSTFPTHEAAAAAKRENRKPEGTPRPESVRPGSLPHGGAQHAGPYGDVVVVDLSSQMVFRAPHLKDFQLPTQANGFVAYLQMPEKPLADEDAASGGGEKSRDQHSRGKKKVEVGELVLRDLNAGSERRFAQVSEYSLTKDGKALVYAVSASASVVNGLYVVSPGETAPVTALLAGKGKYEKVAWDEDQTRLAFLSNQDQAADTGSPDFKLYTWDRRALAADEVLSDQSPGFPRGWTISSKASLAIAKGGTRIFLGTTPRRESMAASTNTPEDERVSVDLWSWRDDYIQPMQKIRAKTEHARSYRAVYDVEAKQFAQLADPAMNDLVPSEDGKFAIGNDDRAYRRMEEYEGNYFDSYVVDTRTGKRKLAAAKHPNRVTWSPDSRYAIYFNGKDWMSIATADARVTNVTAKLGVSFANEQNDTPGLADSYRLGGWTRDGRSLLLYDRYDIWQCSPDGSVAVNLTQGAGRKSRLQFRVVRFETDDPQSRWIDASKPLLLRAENEQTRDTGFYQTSIAANAPPRKLLFAAKNFAPPIKAANADVYVTAASTFSEYPDLLVTDGAFHELNKVSNANPQLAGLLWGTAELVHFNNVDGIPLQAILYKPANFDPKKKYPMIVYIYERLTQNVRNFIEPRPYNVISPSLYASNGYLVLEPDIVYKVGYPGQSASNCVLPAVQSVVDQGFINENAIGIQGHSWGGYQIAYMITRTNRFRAAAAGAPVADMISAYDGIRWGPGIPRQFQYERTQSRIGGSVWEYPLRYIENSPIFAADRVNTPLLMMHNDADDAVPWYQGIEYYLALRRLNKEVYMFTYNGEPHNLRRRANQKDYALKMQQYFDHWLKGAPEPEWMENGIPYLEKPGVAATLNADDQP